jgi:hypothetical protein
VNCREMTGDDVHPDLHILLYIRLGIIAKPIPYVESFTHYQPAESCLTYKEGGEKIRSIKQSRGSKSPLDCRVSVTNSRLLRHFHEFGPRTSRYHLVPTSFSGHSPILCHPGLSRKANHSYPSHALSSDAFPHSFRALLKT